METHQLEFFGQEPQPPQQEEIKQVPLQQKEIGKILGKLGVPSDPNIIEVAIKALKKVSEKYHEQKKLKENNPGYVVTADWMSLAKSERPEPFNEHQWQSFNGKRQEIWKILNDTSIPPHAKA